MSATGGIQAWVWDRWNSHVERTMEIAGENPLVETIAKYMLFVC